jgi:DNA adenine methylase
VQGRCVKPLLKWPGGKERELARILPFLPAYERYVEPFLGGGALFFALEPAEALVSDINPQLMGLYRLIAASPAALSGELDRYVDARHAAARFAVEIEEAVLALHLALRPGDDRIQPVRALLDAARSSYKLRFARFFGSSVELDLLIEKSLADKLARIARFAADGRSWPLADVRTHVTTALQAALYTYVRDCHEPETEIGRAAAFLFIRSYCYGSMFRYSRSGHFNISYGGESYDQNELTTKIQQLVAPETIALLQRTELHCGSYHDLELRPSDFLFLDPPYDSTFSEYDQFSFGHAEQEHLADWFSGLPCPALMIIGKSPFIEALYRDRQEANPQIVIESYDKRYGFNIKGRTERAITHLQIRNYAAPPPRRPWRVERLIFLRIRLCQFASSVAGGRAASETPRRWNACLADRHAGLRHPDPPSAEARSRARRRPIVERCRGGRSPDRATAVALRSPN